MELEVRHATDGNGKYRPAKAIKRTIVAWYGPNKVRDHAGDVWFITKKDEKLVTIG